MRMDRHRSGVARIAIRRLRRGETALFEQHLLRLDPESRRKRFGRIVSDAVVASYARAEAARPGLIEGAFVAGVLRGVAELRPIADGRAEAAFSVEAAFQGRGIGSRLLRRLVLVARNDAIGSLTVLCLPENGAMQRLARRHGGVLVRWPGEVEAKLSGAAPTGLSLLSEEMAECSARLATAWDWWLRNNLFAAAVMESAERARG